MTSRASISRSPFTNTNSRARTPTLMRGQPADAVCRRAPARLHRFTKVTVGVPFADSARDLDAIGSRVIWFQDNHSDSPCFTALSGVGLLVAYAPRRGVIGHTTGSVTKGRETSSGQVQHYVPGFTEPTLMLRIKYRHGSASARCLTRHFPPAPFAAALRCTDFAGCSRSFRRSQIAETGMDSGGHSH